MTVTSTASGPGNEPDPAGPRCHRTKRRATDSRTGRTPRRHRDDDPELVGSGRRSTASRSTRRRAGPGSPGETPARCRGHLPRGPVPVAGRTGLRAPRVLPGSGPPPSQRGVRRLVLAPPRVTFALSGRSRIDHRSLSDRSTDAARTWPVPEHGHRSGISRHRATAFGEQLLVVLDR